MSQTSLEEARRLVERAHATLEAPLEPFAPTDQLVRTHQAVSLLERRARTTAEFLQSRQRKLGGIDKEIQQAERPLSSKLLASFVANGVRELLATVRRHRLDNDRLGTALSSRWALVHEIAAEAANAPITELMLARENHGLTVALERRAGQQLDLNYDKGTPEQRAEMEEAGYQPSLGDAIAIRTNGNRFLSDASRDVDAAVVVARSTTRSRSASSLDIGGAEL